MPHQLEFFKMAERTGANTKKGIIAMLLAIIIGVSITFWIYPYTLYKYGASNAGELLGAGWQAYDNLSAWYLHPRNTDITGLSAISVSIVFTLMIWLGRMKFFWFPFHPAGYALGISSGTIDVYWFALLVCSVIKWVVLRYGGIKSYQKVVPFFMGLVIGDFVVGCFWGILSLIVQRPLYTTWF
ncbi:MAG: hypothetical protein FJ041_06725 [Candidatus Cloacimonetes bacterium]|nr:hypothetical protein [Candidatus Cloacimonadota bacterium]